MLQRHIDRFNDLTTGRFNARYQLPLHVSLSDGAIILDSVGEITGAEFIQRYIIALPYSPQRYRVADNWRALMSDSRTATIRDPELGRKISACVANDDEEGLFELIDGIPLTLSLRRLISECEGVAICADCGDEIVWTDNSDYSDTHDGHICHSCSRHHVITEDTNRFLDRDDDNIYWAYTSYRYGSVEDTRAFESCDELYTYNGDWVTSGVASNLFYWESDGEYHREPEEEEEEDEESRYGIYPYHSHPYRNNGYFKESSSQDNPAFGLEIEIDCTGSAYDALQRIDLDWILETDGSLDSSKGVEIISPPFAYSEWSEIIPELCSALTDENATGWNTRGRYGIHITLHRRHLTPLQEARISKFLTDYENRNFVRAIAQRHDIYSASINIGSFEKKENNCSRYGGVNTESFDSKPRLRGYSKCVPLNLKPRLAEMRIFQSTLKPESILKNVEFYKALLDWTRLGESTGFDHRDFYSWLTSYRNKSQYKNLKEHLKKDSFKLKDGFTVDNTWSK